MSRIDPHSYTDLDQGIVTQLSLVLTIDFAAHQLRGSATLTLDKQHRGALDLDSRDLTIHRVVGQNGKAIPWKLGEKEKVLGARLRLDLPKATRTVTIEYSTSPAASALQWLEPVHTAGGQQPYLFSQCQPHHARAIVPLQDSAAVRFPYRAEVTVPAPLVAVMSAAPGSIKGRDAETVTYAFDMPQPIPSYLLALAVGNIAHRELSPRIRIYAEPETLDKAAWEFAEANAMLEKAESLFGPYRWDRYDFLVMPPAFPYGGMENPRLTFLTPTLLAGDRSLVNVLAHELAHSWTGNLVTNRTMNDFWLNEGFTVWAERRILEALAGEDAVAMASAIGRQDLQEELNRFGNDSPYTRLKTDLAGIDPDDVYSQVPYEKGFLFVALIERTVGRARFDNFLRAYMDRFAFQSISTEDFLTFLDAELPGVAAQINAQQWVYGPGLLGNAPEFHSPRITELRETADAFTRGERPAPAETKKWRVDEWLVFLGELPKELDTKDCAYLDEGLGLGKSGNAEILCKWLVIAAGSNYAPADMAIRRFLGSVGRMKYLKPLYKALYKNEKTRDKALALFAEFAGRYHPIARGGLQGLLRG